MGAVPRYARPLQQLPAAAETMIDILGANRVRIAILRHLAGHSPATATEISTAIGSRRPTVYAHLLELETAGAVNADAPADQRNGRTVRFTLTHQRVADHLASLTQAILHPGDPG